MPRRRHLPVVLALVATAACGKDSGGDPVDRDDGRRDAGEEPTSMDDALGGEPDEGSGDIGGCVEGSAQCTSTTTGLQCVGGAILPFACADGWSCVVDRCAPPAEGCVPGVRACDGDNVVACDGDGAGTTAVEACADGCQNGSCIVTCTGDDEKSYLGCTFFAVDLDNSAQAAFGNSADAQQFAVTVSNPGTRAVEVVVRPSFDATVFGPFVVGPDELAVIRLPRADANDTSLTRNSFQVQASGPVTAHQFNPEQNVDVYSNDASLLLPATALGRAYMVLGWPTEVQQVPLVGPRVFPQFVTIVAIAPGATRVTLQTPSTSGIRAGDGVAAVAASSSAVFDLTQGHVLALMTPAVHDADLSGMRIDASQPVSVFVGNECAFVPHGNVYCDHLEDQIAPTSTWGTRYVAPKTLRRGTEPDLYRVVALNDGTTITTTPPQDGAPSVLQAGVPATFVSGEDFVVEGSGPIAVAQLLVGSGYPGPANGCTRDDTGPEPSRCAIPADLDCSAGETSSAIGDPGLVFLVPDLQHRQEYLVLTPADYEVDGLSFVVPDGVTVTLDGAPIAAPAPIAGAGVGVARMQVGDGPHRVSATGPIGLYAYGYDCDVSYAYAGGMDLIER